MKNIKRFILIIIFTIMFSAFTLNANAVSECDKEYFGCEIGDYVIEYNICGEIKNVLSASTGLSVPQKMFQSDFYPKNESQCPKENEVSIMLTDSGKTFYVMSKDTYEENKEYIENVEKEDKEYSDLGSCSGYKEPSACWNNPYYACVWNETKYGNYCNVDELLYVRCGDAKDIPYQVPGIISFAVNFLKILAPIILIIVSVISLLKALSASNEDEIKKAQKGLIRKIIAAVLVFFVITIVQFVIMKVADSEIKSDENGKVETTNLSDCLNCLLNNECQETVYYKDYIGSRVDEVPVTEINK